MCPRAGATGRATSSCPRWRQHLAGPSKCETRPGSATTSTLSRFAASRRARNRSLPDRRAGPHVWWVYMVAGLATLIWSINFIFAKHALREFPPMLVSGLRTAIAALLIAPIFLWHMNRSDRPQFSRRDLFVVTALGIIGGGLNQVLFVLGLSRTTVAHAAIIVGLTPVVVLLIANLLGHERFKPMQLGGMLVALAGVAVLQISSQGGREASLSGDL